jgi:predicted butyrate kinase (DUF1464 family)
MEIVHKALPLDMLIAPSGFGLPLKRIQDLTEEDYFKITLKKEITKSSIVGLTRVLKLLQDEKINAYILPSVKHLPTVPEYRKVNKIDLGTSDKVSATVVGIKNQMEDYHIHCNQTSFIMVELGHAFNSVIAVEDGKIIDGIGGTNLMGFRAIGALDAEVAYLLGQIKKKDIYNGGVYSIAGYYSELQTKETSDIDIQQLFQLIGKNKKVKLAFDALYDSLKKAVFSISSSFSDPKKIKNILLSGRVARIEDIINPLNSMLKQISPVKHMRSYSTIAKEAAQGAAFIADGLLGGMHKDIIENLKIKESTGSVLDNIFVPITRNVN